jgi:sulfate adenylyltransferase
MIDEEEYLISYANLKSGLFSHQENFLDKKNLEKFYKNSYLGMPICLPLGIKFFDYSQAKIFKIDKLKFSKKIFGTSKLTYIGNKKFFRYGEIFATNALLKKKYYNRYKFYFSNIKKTKNVISLIRKKHKKVCSMQIRNAPHYGHEAVFKYILRKFDILILNPIFGIKKKNDFSDKIITKSLKFMEKKYKRIKFLPIWSSFHYAGPREAMHHLLMRENLGFNYFYIGRDHAGAQNLYRPNAASETAIKYKKKFKIKSITSKGGYLCLKCKDYVIKGICGHKGLINISGTDFRFSLKEKSVYQHSDKELQKIIYKRI